jgi:hypothetical protein
LVRVMELHGRDEVCPEHLHNTGTQTDTHLIPGTQTDHSLNGT